MGAIERTLSAVADYTVGSSIVMIHLILAGIDRQRAERLREEQLPWRRGRVVLPRASASRSSAR